MEHTLWGLVIEGMKNNEKGLNPCFNGTYSMSLLYLRKITVMISLNPCFNGTYSMRALRSTWRKRPLQVLILVLMEHTLWELQVVELATGSYKS